MNELYVVELLKVLKNIDRTLIRIQQGQKPIAPAESGKFFLIEDGQKKRWETMLSVKADSGPKKFMVEFIDKLGNLAPVEKDLKESLLNADQGIAEIKNLVLAEDGKSATGELHFLGKVGNTKIQMDPDGDMDPSVEARFHLESEDVVVSAANASGGRIVFLPDEEPIPTP